MCHSDAAEPPAPPGGAGSTVSRDLTLTASDGNVLLAYLSRPARPNGRGVVIMPDVRGLHCFYKELAVRFAEAGFDAVAIDYFGRSAADPDRGESFAWQDHVKATTPEMVAADVRAAVQLLRSAEGGGSSRVFTVGFCWGGSGSWRQSAEGHGLAGCIGFYGGHPMTAVGPWIERMRAPLLLLLAEHDSTPPEEFTEFADKVRARGIPVEAQTFAGTPHSFFDRRMTEHRAACEAAWRRIERFTEPSPAVA